MEGFGLPMSFGKKPKRGGGPAMGAGSSKRVEETKRVSLLFCRSIPLSLGNLCSRSRSLLARRLY